MATIHPLFKENQANDMQTASNQSANFTPSVQPPILALSTNDNMLEIVRRAVPTGSQLIDTRSLDAMMTQCRTVRPGVLLLDTACCPDITGTVIQLMQDLPNLVVVVAGKTEDSTALMKLTAAGHIYRFLLMPLAHSQTKLTLEAAMTQHFELGNANNRREANADNEGGEARKSYLPAYIGLGAALIVVVGGAFYGLSRMGSGDANVAATAGVTANSGASKELALADAALAAGKLLEPAGESALDLYRSALSINPKDTRAAAGVDAVANKLLEQAETALTAEQLEKAVTVLEQARDVSPDNARLKFLDGQVSRERERLKLTQANDVGKKVRTLLAAAQEDMDAGRLINPAGNNARDSILDARKADPTDPTVTQAQRALASRIIDAARRAVEQNQTEQAQALLAAARQLGSAGADLSALERSIAAERVSAEAPPPRPRAVETKTNDTQAAAAQQKALAAAAQAEREAAQAAAAAATQRAAAEAAAAQAAASAAAQAPVALKRTKTVAPVFPDTAKSRGASGWVEVGFTVSQNGSVDNVHVLNAEPKDVFDFAAIQAVEQWRFEPPMRDGKPTSQVTKIKLRFDNQK
jgi:TonB family protein